MYVYVCVRVAEPFEPLFTVGSIILFVCVGINKISSYIANGINPTNHETQIFIPPILYCPRL